MKMVSEIHGQMPSNAILFRYLQDLLEFSQVRDDVGIKLPFFRLSSTIAFTVFRPSYAENHFSGDRCFNPTSWLSQT
jgi:hypothetical protein